MLYITWRTLSVSRRSPALTNSSGRSCRRSLTYHVGLGFLGFWVSGFWGFWVSGLGLRVSEVEGLRSGLGLRLRLGLGL